MEGFLLIYKNNDRKALNKLNHSLNGRIIRIPYMGAKASYYYPGLLDDVLHKRLKDGCYIIKGDDDIMESVKEFVEGKADVYSALVPEIQDEDLYTAREYWQDRANSFGWLVKNL